MADSGGGMPNHSAGAAANQCQMDFPVALPYRAIHAAHAADTFPALPGARLAHRFRPEAFPGNPT